MPRCRCLNRFVVTKWDLMRPFSHTITKILDSVHAIILINGIQGVTISRLFLHSACHSMKMFQDCTFTKQKDDHTSMQGFHHSASHHTQCPKHIEILCQRCVFMRNNGFSAKKIRHPLLQECNWFRLIKSSLRIMKQ